MEKMTIEEYAQEIANRIEYTTLQMVEKNGVMKHGLIQKLPESNVGATVYIEDFYEDNVTVDEAVKHIMNIFAEHGVQKQVNFAWLSDFDAIKGKLTMRLLNKATVSNNTQIITEDATPYGFDDCVLIPTLLLSEEDLAEVHTELRGAIKVTYNMAKVWGIESNEVCRIAMENTKSVIPSIQTMTEFLNNHIEEEFLPELPLLVISNRWYSYGAVMAIILKEQLLKKFKHGYFVIPSSVHETIIVPKEFGIDVDSLNEFVKTVNGTCLKPEDILSDQVYDVA